MAKSKGLKQCEFCKHCAEDMTLKDYVCACEKSENYLKSVTRTQDACSQFEEDD